MAASVRMLDPLKAKYLQTLYRKISAKPWFTRDPSHARVFASRLVMFYEKLDIAQDRFADFAEAHAKQNFRRKIQFDEDIARSPGGPAHPRYLTSSRTLRTR